MRKWILAALLTVCLLFVPFSTLSSPTPAELPALKLSDPAELEPEEYPQLNVDLSDPETYLITAVPHHTMEELPGDMQEFVFSFLNRWQQSISDLSAEDLMGYFDLSTLEGYESYQINQFTLEYMVFLREHQTIDLTIEEMEYSLELVSYWESEDEILLFLLENSCTVFSAYPDTTAQNAGYHIFRLVETPRGWKLRFYQNRQDIGLSILEAYRAERVYPSDLSLRQRCLEIIDMLRETFEAEALEDLEALAGRFSAPSLPSDELPPDDLVPYDRDEALRYAADWSQLEGERRNELWADYEMYGGDCNNFVSQCLYAGGIPMDLIGQYLWKWYDDRLDNTSRARGRTPSWSGVDEFYDYASYNQGGYGLYAVCDAPLSMVEPGDVLQFSSGGDWRHSVIVTQVLRDENGVIQDLLVASHSADRYDYPLSAYFYTRIRLIHIAGWVDD